MVAIESHVPPEHAGAIPKVPKKVGTVVDEPVLPAVTHGLVEVDHAAVVILRGVGLNTTTGQP